MHERTAAHQHTHHPNATPHATSDASAGVTVTKATLETLAQSRVLAKGKVEAVWAGLLEHGTVLGESALPHGKGQVSEPIRQLAELAGAVFLAPRGTVALKAALAKNLERPPLVLHQLRGFEVFGPFVDPLFPGLRAKLEGAVA